MAHASLPVTRVMAIVFVITTDDDVLFQVDREKRGRVRHRGEDLPGMCRPGPASTTHCMRSVKANGGSP